MLPPAVSRVWGSKCESLKTSFNFCSCKDSSEAPKFQDFACHIAFQNQFPGPVKLYWIHDGDHELASISEKLGRKRLGKWDNWKILKWCQLVFRLWSFWTMNLFVLRTSLSFLLPGVSFFWTSNVQTKTLIWWLRKAVHRPFHRCKLMPRHLGMWSCPVKSLPQFGNPHLRFKGKEV